MTGLNHKAVAEAFDTIGEGMAALAALFRNGSGSAGSASADGKAAKPVRGRKASTPAEEEIDIDTVREALTELVELRGKEVMVSALESVGAGKLADVDESQYQELMDKVAELKEEPADAPAPSKVTKPTRTRGKKPAGPTLDEVTEAAKALIEADKPAYVKLTKKLGKPSEMEEADYAEAIAAYEAAMPEEGDDDLL